MNRLGHLNFRRLEECATIVGWLDAKPDERILDVGCGNGYYDHLVAGAGAEVVGIDVRESALAEAARSRRSPRCSFVHTAAEDLAMPDASFDKVLSLCVMEHLTDDRKVMRHVWRLLRPGGRFVFSADSLSNPELTDEERDRHREMYAVNTFYVIEQVREKLSDAGFHVEEWRYILNTPLALAAVRLSWALDRLPAALSVFRGLGYLALLSIAKMSGRFPSRLSTHSSTGLTLLVRAVKVTTAAPASQK